MKRYNPINGKIDHRPIGTASFKYDLDLELKAAFPKLKVVDGIPEEAPLLDINQKEETKFTSFIVTYNPFVEIPNIRTGDLAKHIHHEFQDLDGEECRLIYRQYPTNLGEGGMVPEGHSMYRKAIFMRLVIVSEEVYQKYLLNKSEGKHEEASR